MSLHDKTRTDEAQGELAQVRRAHAMVPHSPAPPPALDPRLWRPPSIAPALKGCAPTQGL